MSTAEEIRERRRQKVLEKLNAKYKDVPNEEEQIITNPIKTETEILPQNPESITKPTPIAPREQPVATEPKTSVFNEYKKMRDFEKFEVNFEICQKITILRNTFLKSRL